VRGQDTGRVLFKESYDPQLLINLGAIPFAFLLAGFFIFTWDPDFGAWPVLIGVLAAVAEYLLLPQRLVVTTVGIQPQLMRFKAIRKRLRVVPWGSVTAVWPVYQSIPLTAKTELRGFEVAAPMLGTARLIPAKGINKKAKVEQLESAVKAGLGARFNAVWREIPDISKDDIERMRKVLMISSKKESVAELGQIYIPLTAIIELQVAYVFLGEMVHGVDQVCLLASLIMAAAAILFLILIVIVYRVWKRQRLHSDMFSLYFQVRRYEESSGKHMLPQMQMLTMYRRMDPRPPPVETWKGPELLKAFKRTNVKLYCWFGASLIIPIAAMMIIFTYHLSPLFLPLVVAFTPAAALLGVSNLFEIMTLTIELKMIVHEEWKTGKSCLPEKASLKLWGIERDPAGLMQKNLPRLRKMAAKGKRSQSLYVEPTVLRAILEYEEVTGRQLLPSELASLREKQKDN